MSDIVSSRKKPMDEAARLAAIHAKLPVTDTAALEAQVAAKRAAEAEAASSDRATAAQLLANAKHAEQLESGRQAAMQAQRRAVGAFQEQQAASYAPPSFDYTLEGPESVASLRRFAGEDPHIRERKAAQAQQLGAWCEESIRDREAQAIQQRNEAQVEHDKLMSLVTQGTALTAAQEARKAKLATDVADANRELAALKRERDEHAAAERAAAEMKALIVDDGPAAGLPPYEFRGFTQQQRQDVLAEQERQRAEAAAQRKAEEDQAHSEAVQQALVKKTADKMAVDALAFQQQQRAAVAAVLERQKADKEKQENQAAEEAKQPVMTDEFQHRFGRHAR